MEMTIRERRQIQNEMIFRRANEKVGIALDEVDALNVDDGNPHLVRKNDLLLDFLCECSNESCTERLTLTLSVYKEMHLTRDNFILRPNHEVGSIEEVISKKADYWLVNKNKSTTEPGNNLNNTVIINT